MAETSPGPSAKPGPKARPGRPMRRVPVRTCVACQEEKPKRDLVRVVHTPAGHIETDPTGKKAGRGAYLCAKRTCWETGFKKHALERALKTTIGPDDLAILQKYAETLAQ